MKKFLALVTLVCMVLSATAFAATPSKTADDLTRIVKLHTESDGWVIRVTDPTEEIEAEVKAIEEFVAAPAAVATFFDEEVQAALVAPELAVETLTDPNALVALELVPVECDGYKAEYGEADADFVFATPYAEEAELIVMLGCAKETVEEGKDAFAWNVQKCTVTGGEVRVHFTVEQLEDMDTRPHLLVVLSAEIAE